MISVLLDGTRTERSVEVETCLDGADLVALTTVLAVEPENAKTPEPRAQAPRTQQVEEEPPAPAQEPQQTPVPAEEPQDAGNSAEGLLGLGAFVRSGSLPGLRPGILARGGLKWDHWQAKIEFRALPPAESLPTGSAAPIDFSMYNLALMGCYAWQIQAFSIGPCAAIEGGAVISDQAGEGAYRSAVVTPWLGLTPGLELGLKLSGSFQIYATGGVSVPLTQVRLELDDGALAHQAGVGGDATLGLHYFF